VVSVTFRPLFIPGKDPVSTVQEAGWVPGPVWTGAENIAPTGIRSPDRPARSSVAMPTELHGPQTVLHTRFLFVLKHFLGSVIWLANVLSTG